MTEVEKGVGGRKAQAFSDPLYGTLAIGGGESQSFRRTYVDGDSWKTPRANIFSSRSFEDSRDNYNSFSVRAQHRTVPSQWWHKDNLEQLRTFFCHILVAWTLVLRRGYSRPTDVNSASVLGSTVNIQQFPGTMIDSNRDCVGSSHVRSSLHQPKIEAF